MKKLRHPSQHKPVFFTLSGGNTLTIEYSFDLQGDDEMAAAAALRNLRRSTGTAEIFGPEMYYLRARYYSPQLGRFTSEDPYWRMQAITRHDPQGLNLYAYVMNNPIRYRDPSGLSVHFSEDDWEGIRKFEARIPEIRARAGHPAVNIPGGGKYHISQNGNNITIRANFTFYDTTRGRALEDGSSYQDAFIAGIIEYWGNAEGFNVSVMLGIVDSGGIEVSIHRIHNVSNMRGGGYSWSRDNPGRVQMYAGYLNSSAYCSVAFRWVAAHEFGHILGVGDAYNRTTGEPRPRLDSVFNAFMTPVQPGDMVKALNAWNQNRWQWW